MDKTYLTHSFRETQELGSRLAQHLRAGDVVTLCGDLGAGKSEFSRGVARGLGITGPVPSPSFTILNTYEGREMFYHFDWYRIADPQELYDIGLDEFVGGDGIALIEWSERAEECLPEDYLQVCIEKVDDGTRSITFRAMGAFRKIMLDGETV
ncbi:MAG: tRNA (adenosine(37)-N6)-threonylcarbamoyltransferase complex ATPase subunit type 1 TsaE [Clostridia bacterium]|nr:tRNA (adenosine(37)-N6)-threonylcarbamoyltransferase complex ATPase subunit type 1 TsaE [Clostridia bacterium]